MMQQAAQAAHQLPGSFQQPGGALFHQQQGAGAGLGRTTDGQGGSGFLHHHAAQHPAPSFAGETTAGHSNCTHSRVRHGSCRQCVSLLASSRVPAFTQGVKGAASLQDCQGSRAFISTLWLLQLCTANRGGWGCTPCRGGGPRACSCPGRGCQAWEGCQVGSLLPASTACTVLLWGSSPPSCASQAACIATRSDTQHNRSRSSMCLVRACRRGSSLRSPFTGFAGRDGTMSPAMQLLQHHQALGSLRPPPPGHHMPRPQHPHPHRPPPPGIPGHMQPPHFGPGPMPRPGGMPPPPWGPPMRPPMHGEPITTVECCSQAMPCTETNVEVPAPPSTCPASSARRPVSCTVHSPAE